MSKFQARPRGAWTLTCFSLMSLTSFARKCTVLSLEFQPLFARTNCVPANSKHELSLEFLAHQLRSRSRLSHFCSIVLFSRFNASAALLPGCQPLSLEKNAPARLSSTYVFFNGALARVPDPSTQTKYVLARILALNTISRCRFSPSIALVLEFWSFRTQIHCALARVSAFFGRHNEFTSIL